MLVAWCVQCFRSIINLDHASSIGDTGNEVDEGVFCLCEFFNDCWAVGKVFLGVEKSVCPLTELIYEGS